MRGFRERNILLNTTLGIALSEKTLKNAALTTTPTSNVRATKSHEIEIRPLPPGLNATNNAVSYVILSLMSSAIQAELPPELLAQAQAYVEEGWATDVNELLAEALRRYLESHSSHLSETFIREDLEWGLKGNE
jgi:hypothetical protein